MGLNRALAPMSEAVWSRVESEARDVLELHLAARRVVDFEGPLGWDHSALDLGRVERLPTEAAPSVMLRKRLVRPLIELRVRFELDREELEGIDRGAPTVNLDPLRDAARQFAAAEDSAVFDGLAAAGIPGLMSAAANQGVSLPDDPARLPEAVSLALDQLRRAGVAGPYALVLGPEAYATLDRAAGDGGYPVSRHVQRLIDRRPIWAPALRGGLLVSLRGGDFRLTCGRDVAIGYLSHDEAQVRLYLEESFTSELSGPEAAVPLRVSDA